MKKVVFGGFLIVGGILLAMLSLLKFDNGISGLIMLFIFAGLLLFIAAGGRKQGRREIAL